MPVETSAPALDIDLMREDTIIFTFPCSPYLRALRLRMPKHANDEQTRYLPLQKHLVERQSKANCKHSRAAQQHSRALAMSTRLSNKPS